MRTAAFLVLAALTAAVGCRKKPAEPPPAVELATPALIVAAAEPEDTPEVWRLVKVELPTAGGTCTEESDRIEFAFLKRARVPEPVAVDKLPPTPAEFSHRGHAVQLGIDCRYCHPGSVTSGKTAERFKAKACMNCHQQLFGKGPEAGKGNRWSFVAVRDATKSPKEIDATECDADGVPLAGSVVRRGIYEEVGDGLRIALAFGDVPADFRPKEFKAAPLPRTGFAGVAVFHLKK